MMSHANGFRRMFRNWSRNFFGRTWFPCWRTALPSRRANLSNKKNIFTKFPNCISIETWETSWPSIRRRRVSEILRGKTPKTKRRRNDDNGKPLLTTPVRRWSWAPTCKVLDSRTEDEQYAFSTTSASAYGKSLNVWIARLQHSMHQPEIKRFRLPALFA